MKAVTGQRKRPKTIQKEEPKPIENNVPGLRQIPIAVSASRVWYIQIEENADEAELAKFIEMQKLIFSLK
jgi:hypothetical protein